MDKIDCFIVGAQKCGTTSLKNYLGEHPEMNAQIQTEMSFFVNDEEYQRGVETMFERYFAKHPKSKLNVAKDVSMSSNEKSLKKLQEHNPECKIIYMVREPVARAFSSYLMESRAGEIDPDFDRLVEKILNKRDDWQFRVFLGLGIYIDDIRKIIKYFPQENVKVVILEEFEQDPRPIMSDIFHWLNVESTFIPNLGVVHNQGGEARSKLLAKLLHDFLQEKNPLKILLKKLLPAKFAARLGEGLRSLNKSKSPVKKTISQKSSVVLSAFFEPYNKELAEFLGRKHPLWKK